MRSHIEENHWSDRLSTNNQMLTGSKELIGAQRLHSASGAAEGSQGWSTRSEAECETPGSVTQDCSQPRKGRQSASMLSVVKGLR